MLFRSDVGAWGDAFRIVDKSTDNQVVVFEEGASAGSLYIKSDGNVGIGTTSPNKILHVVTGAAQLGRFETTSSNRGLELYSSATAFTGAIADVEFRAKDSTNVETEYVRIGGAVVDNTDGSEDGEFRIFTKKAGTLTQQVTVDENGNVGIGTTAPGAKLDISQSTGGVAALRVYNSDATQAYGFLVDNTAHTTGETYYIADFRSGGTTRLRIANSGNVGIGTTSPSQELTIVGNAKLAGAQNGNIAKMIMTRTDASWSINNETDFRLDRKSVV